jgi:hypothetical protein
MDIRSPDISGRDQGKVSKAVDSRVETVVSKGAGEKVGTTARAGIIGIIRMVRILHRRVGATGAGRSGTKNC